MEVSSIWRIKIRTDRGTRTVTKDRDTGHWSVTAPVGHRNGAVDSWLDSMLGNADTPNPRAGERISGTPPMRQETLDWALDAVAAQGVHTVDALTLTRIVRSRPSAC